VAAVTAQATVNTETGQRSSVVDGRGTTQYTYDDLDRLTGVTVPSALGVSYTYDAAGKRRSMTTPAGTITLGYDAANRLSTVTDPSGGTYAYLYDIEGRRTQLAMPNGVIVDYRYDSLDRLIGITQSSSSTVLASYNYTLDPTGNRLSVTEADGSSIAWSYDDAYRLLGETRFNAGGTPTNETTFAYDPVGNRLSMTIDGATTSYAYNELDQLLTAGGVSFAYDARGNFTRATGGADVTAYSWDALDRLSDATLPDGTALAYTYDADGRRVRQTVGGSETNYLWDEASLYGDVVLETDGAGAAGASYVLGGPELLSQTRGGSTSYYLADGQGSTRALTNSAAAVTDTYEYTAFGELFAGTGSTANPYLYTGQQFDVLSGLYSLRARYYDAGIGRFLSRDPAELDVFNPTKLNRYFYGSNNPATMSDPSGLDTATYEYGSLLAGLLRALAAAKAAVVPVVARSVAWVLVSLLVTGLPGAVPDVGEAEDPALPEVWREAIERAFEQVEQSEVLREALEALRRTKPLPKTDPDIEITPIPPIWIDSTPPPGETVTIYRAVGGRLSADGSYWRIPDLRNPEFDPNPDPRGLSTFEYGYLNIPKSNLRNPYLFPFAVSLPQDGRTPLEAYPINVPGCTASYTPPPPGHWIVSCGTGDREVTRSTLSTFAGTQQNRGTSIVNTFYTGSPQERRFEWQIP